MKDTSENNTSSIQTQNREARWGGISDDTLDIGYYLPKATDEEDAKRILESHLGLTAKHLEQLDPDLLGVTLKLLQEDSKDIGKILRQLGIDMGDMSFRERREIRNNSLEFLQELLNKFRERDIPVQAILGFGSCFDLRKGTTLKQDLDILVIPTDLGGYYNRIRYDSDTSDLWDLANYTPEPIQDITQNMFDHKRAATTKGFPTKLDAKLAPNLTTEGFGAGFGGFFTDALIGGLTRGAVVVARSKEIINILEKQFKLREKGCSYYLLEEDGSINPISTQQ